jgi:hypothetical protein
MLSTIGRYSVLLFVFALAWGGCGSDSEVALEGEAATQAAPIGGMYQVSGVTAAAAGGHEREISGTIILADQGDRYTATFSLDTLYPIGGESLPTEVIGTGEGTIEGRTLRGTAQIQLVTTTVPGVDPAFAFIPRTVSTRLVSTTVTTLTPDGAVAIELENAPAPGEQYVPTRTVLSGVRTSAAGVGGEPTPPSDPPQGDEG